MEESLIQQKESSNQIAVVENGITTYNPAVYRMAEKGTEVLSVEQGLKLTRDFDDDQIEIRPDGIIYIPAALIRKRFIEAVGPSGFALLCFRSFEEEMGNGEFKVYYDGGLYMGAYYVAKSIGEGVYHKKNKNTSQASALESAKTDCLVRCAKDLGVGLQVFEPSFIRNWRKKNAVKVYVEEFRNGEKKKTALWRRLDVDPFIGELGPVPTYVPNVNKAADKPGEKQSEKKEDLPWLNKNERYLQLLRELKDMKITVPQIEEKYRLSTAIRADIVHSLSRDWEKYTNDKKSMKELTALYNQDKEWIEQHDFIRKIFSDRREQLQPKKAAS